jgi:hypothetical protein
MSRQKKSIDSVEEPKTEVTFSEEHRADLSEVKIQKTKKEMSKELLDKFIKEETQLVKGKFRNFEVPGGSQRVIVKKYADVPMFDKVMEDGKVYEIPLYVARHLNGVDATAKKVNGKINTCSFPVHGFKWDGDKGAPKNVEEAGIPVPIIAPAKWTRRYGFESLEFDMEL